MEQSSQSGRRAADFVLTGASRLVTLAPEAIPGATEALGVVERGALAARAGRVVWAGPEAQLAAAVDLEVEFPTSFQR